jgi:hypothetical protein
VPISREPAPVDKFQSLKEFWALAKHEKDEMANGAAVKLLSR